MASTAETSRTYCTEGLDPKNPLVAHILEEIKYTERQIERANNKNHCLIVCILKAIKYTEEENKNHYPVYFYAQLAMLHEALSKPETLNFYRDDPTTAKSTNESGNNDTVPIQADSCAKSPQLV